MTELHFGKRRAKYIDISLESKTNTKSLSADDFKHYESFDVIYRSLCALLYNYVPMSGHPGGSISSGHFVATLLYDTMDYDFSNPDREDADLISYGAGHKALGLYAMWALRNEICRIGARELLPKDERLQLRLEDLLGFRRNPVTSTSLFKKFRVKALDGHPTPATPFLKLSTGASGVGVASSLGLAFGAADYYGSKGPKVHIIEGEGGLTPGRVAEAMAAAGTASLQNAFMHIDWNQASIDSDRVCRDERGPGDYVQWDPRELAYLHDWNVIYVPDGFDFHQVVAAQQKALSLETGQPTAIVYRTTKGWKYGIEGKASHGAGHKLCSTAFLDSVSPLLKEMPKTLPTCEADAQECKGGKDESMVEECFWEALNVVRTSLEKNEAMVKILAGRLSTSKERLENQKRKPREGAPRIEAVYEVAKRNAKDVPEACALKVGASTTLRAELGRVFNYLNKESQGALFVSAADLLGSTSINVSAKGFPEGFYHYASNPGSRTLSIGGICEDAMAGILSGISSYGHAIGVGSSYGAFIAALGHIAARLHAIGNQSRQAIAKAPYNPFILVCAHAGLKTGEDGPTHADPQPLALVQENFPNGTAITLTPWDPQEMWPLMAEALTKRPAVIVPFVTRPNETVLDRKSLGLAPALHAAEGVYALRKAQGKGDGTVVLQESGVTYAFIEQTLPRLLKEGIDLNVYYVASAELFSLRSADEQEKIFPEATAKEAMGITGFTHATMYRWVTSDQGRALTLHPFQKGHFLGSGQAQKVLEEAGLDGEGQFKGIRKYLDKRKRS